MELDWKDWKEIFENTASTAKESDDASSKPMKTLEAQREENKKALMEIGKKMWRRRHFLKRKYAQSQLFARHRSGEGHFCKQEDA